MMWLAVGVVLVYAVGGLCLLALCRAASRADGEAGEGRTTSCSS